MIFPMFTGLSCGRFLCSWSASPPGRFWSVGRLLSVGRSVGGGGGGSLLHVHTYTHIHTQVYRHTHLGIIVHTYLHTYTHKNAYEGVREKRL